MPRRLILLFAVLVLLAIASLSAQESAPTPTATERPVEELSKEELLDLLAKKDTELAKKDTALSTAEAGRATAAAGRATEAAGRATAAAGRATAAALVEAEKAEFLSVVLRYFRAGGEPSSKSPLNTLTRKELLELLAGESARADAAKLRADMAIERAQSATARADAELERFIWFEVIRLKLEGELSEDLPLLPDPPPRPTATPTPQPSPSSTSASPTAPPSWEHLSWEELLALLASEAQRAEAESQRAAEWSARAEAETARAEDIREHLDVVEQAVAALRATLTPSPNHTPTNDR